MRRGLAKGVGEQSEAEQARVALQQAVEDAEGELARGEHVDNDVIMAKLRRWADDKT